MNKRKISVFKYGQYISNNINQIANNLIFPESEADFLNLKENSNIATSNCINFQGIGDCEFGLVEEMNKKLHSTFLVKNIGDSMVDIGLNSGDVLLVDSSLQAINNSIIVAEFNNCIVIRRISLVKNNFVLLSDNKKNKQYKPIVVNKSDNLIVWGVVVCTINSI